MTEDAVPFADLYAQYLSIREEIDAAIAAVISSSAFIRGPFVEAFERDFAAAIGTSRCVSCGNGTDAIYIAMHALGLRPGDEVITTAHSWIATSETITQAGGQVVFCDTEADTFNIDVGMLESLVTPRTVGIIPVHLFGQPANMDEVMAVARKHGLWIIEDCAQAHLATYKGRRVGTLGAVGTFSFYPGKNLGAMGDAGAIVTSDDALADRMAKFARHGGLRKGEHEIEGINSRLDGLQAAILSVKLRHLADWVEARQAIARRYDRSLAGAPALLTPVVAPDRTHVYHLYVVKHARRDQLARQLANRGIQTVINYPVALPFLPAYARLKLSPSQFPNAYRNQGEVLSLPIFAEMTDRQFDKVIHAVRNCGL